MKALVLLSGTIRSPEKSLATLKLLRESGFEVDVSIHTWNELTDINQSGWSQKLPALEPSFDLLRLYQANRICFDNWQVYSQRFRQQADRWTKEYGCPPCEKLGTIAMFWGMQEAADLSGILDPFWGGHVLKKIGYDLILRLRFDCQLLEPPQQFGMEPGWVIPGGARPEDRELQDMVAWYIPDQKDLYRCPDEIAAYFETFSRLDRLIEVGYRCKPEELLYQSMKTMEVSWRRVPANWLVHYGVP